MILFFTLLAQATPSFVTPVLQTMGEVQINWTDLRLEAHGSYTSRTQSWGYRESLACQEVSQKLKNNISSVPLNRTSTIESLYEIDEPKNTFANNMRSWKTAETRYITSEHQVDVKGFLSFQHFLRKSIIYYASKDVPANPPQIHTGLIIDARGSNFHPVIMPRVQNTNGDLIMSIDHFSKEAAQDTMPVRYVTTPVDTLCAKTVGKTPAFVRASKQKNNALVIDGGSLPSQSDLISIIATGKVVIILDPSL